MSTKSTKDTKQIDMLCVLIQFPLFCENQQITSPMKTFVLFVFFVDKL
jgi:hypothetical protein